jgi:hypothetical protein
MDSQLMLDLPTLDPIGRRNWLLTKALENAPLADALSLAQAVEDFLVGKAQGTADPAAELKPGVSAEIPLQTLTVPEARNAKFSEALEGFSSLASVDEVMRYLSQCGEDVSAETANADELIVRANRKRTSQGLPPFALLPITPTRVTRQDKPAQAKKVAPPRPPSARERAEWARRVVALPAALSTAMT